MILFVALLLCCFGGATSGRSTAYREPIRDCQGFSTDSPSYVPCETWRNFMIAATASAKRERGSDGRLRAVIDPTQPIIWWSRPYYFGAVHVPAVGAEPSTKDRRVHGEWLDQTPVVLNNTACCDLTTIAWTCPGESFCCGMACCVPTKDTGIGNLYWIPVGFLVIPLLMVCYWLLAKPPADLPPKEPKVPKEAAAPANVKAPLLKKPPPPLPTDVELRYCESRLNTDFRELEEIHPVFRGSERYIRPMGSYRYPLKVLRKYPDDAWLGCKALPGEWQAAYHGTHFENISGIILDGFKLEYCQRSWQAEHKEANIYATFQLW